MIIINRNQKLKEYQIPKMPVYERVTLEHVWLKEQERNAKLVNIKSIDIQIKDINQMIYSNSFRMVSAFAKYQRYLRRFSHSDEEFITIYKCEKGNKKPINNKLIFDIITADWIIDMDEIRNKSRETLLEEISSLEYQIGELKEKLASSSLSKVDLNNKIQLLSYKKTCLEDYLNEKTKDSDKVKKLVNKKKEE